MRFKGFTLIELLVVIAIIAILAAILFPVFSQAKAAAKQSACLSNMRQIGMATQLYLNDNDGGFPQSKKSDTQPQIDDYDGSMEDPDTGSVFATLLNYTGHGGTSSEDVMFQQKLYADPADPNPFDPNCPDVVNIGGPHVISYVINGYYVWGLNESQIPTPASNIEYAERRSVTVNGAAPYCDDIYHPWFNSSNPNVPNTVDNEMDASVGAIATTRHNQGSNFDFADGHAKFYIWSQTWNPPKVDLHSVFQPGYWQ